MVHGVFQRLGILVEALCRCSTVVDCLFLVPRDTDVSKARVAQLQTRLSLTWSPKVRLHVAPALEFPKARPTRFQRYVKAALSPKFVECLTPYLNDSTLDAIGKLLGAHPDLIVAHRLQPMFLLSGLADACGGAPILFDMDDVEHVAFCRRLLSKPGWPLERLRLVQVPMLAFCERQAVRSATRALVCSEADREYVCGLFRVSNVQVVPNAVNIPDCENDESEPVILFVGTFGYPPNVAAADWLVNKIWPSVRLQVPDARLVLVGKDPKFIPGYGTPSPGVEFAGFVPDLAPYYARARVVCCPILSGSGMRIKILEAASFGKAIVSTSVGAEGITLDPETEFIRADTTADIVTACVRLLQNNAEAVRLGKAAKEKICSRYSRETTVEVLRGIIDSCLRESADK